MKHDMIGQGAIVTGGARGIGRGIADRLIAEGCKVAVWDQDLSPLKTGQPQPAFARQVDLTDLKAVEASFAETLSAIGPVSIFVNNAGINGPVMDSTEYPPDAWNRVIAVNLTAVFYCCRTVVPHMKERGYGRIVTVASIAGKEGMARIAAYSASKHGVIGYCKSLARELIGTGVLVNCVAPVITETDLFKEMTREHIDGARAKIPMGRFLKIEEIAAMVAWIASPECSFTTGFTFDLSGGRADY
ncbi:MAG TPA: SDR family NAD(P)-dependent oxidoreductase [Pseudorhodoplanes sp.]|jgi:3-oxoacyl-[acyl-carrier protein] reductase|nr:SDR family NAD(P)-dependent oxidoreductase [Pseudorhodoplanes sp.]